MTYYNSDPKPEPRAKRIRIPAKRNPESINETFEKTGIDISGKEDGCTEDRHVPGCRHEGKNEPNKRLMK